MAIALFIGVLALVSAVIFMILKRERSKEKRRFDSLVEKVQAADRADETGEDIPVKEVPAAEPEFTPKWRKQIDPLRKAVEDLGLKAEALIAARDENRSAAGAQSDSDNDYRWFDRWPSSDDPLDAETLVKDKQDKFCRRAEKMEAANQAALALQEAAEPARLAWEKLAGLIAQLPSREVEDAPREARAILSAAIHLRDHYRSTIKELVEQVLIHEFHPESPRKPKHTMARLETKLDAARESLIAAIVKERQIASLASAASSARSYVDNWSSSDFSPKPQKPTEEEVVRFLKLYQRWAEDRIPKLREAGSKLKELEDGFAELEKAVQASGKLIAKLPNVDSGDTAEVDVQAMYNSLVHFQNALEKKLGSRRESLEETRKGCKDESEPKPVSSPREDELSEQIWGLSRKLGYAIAQRKVAASKADDHRSSGHFPDIRAPRVESGFEMEEFVSRHAAYLEELVAREEEISLHNARAEVLSTALVARKEKIEACALLLAEAVQAATKELGEDVSDPMKVCLIYSSRLADDFKSEAAQKGSTLVGRFGPRPFY